MRDTIETAEARTASEIMSEARAAQARHGGSALVRILRALPGAVPNLRGARGPLGAGQLVLH